MPKNNKVYTFLQYLYDRAYILPIDLIGIIIYITVYVEQNIQEWT